MLYIMVLYIHSWHYTAVSSASHHKAALVMLEQNYAQDHV